MCIGFLFNIGQSLKQLPLSTSFSTLVFPKYFAPYISSYSSSYNTRRSQSGGNFLVIPKFQPSVHKSVSLVIVLLSMLPLSGMLFLMRFVRPPLLPPSENGSKPTFTPRHTLLSFTHPCVLRGAELFSVPGY